MIQLKRGVVLTQADEQIVLTGTGRKASYFRLNEVGAIMLRSLLDDQEPATICSTIAGEYAVDIERVSGDMESLLASLRDADLIHEKSDTR